MKRYKQGITLIVYGQFTDANGNAYDPTTVQGLYANSAGVTTKEYGTDPEITMVNTGHYKFTFHLTVSGVWHAGLAGDPAGSVRVLEWVDFEVEDSPFS